MKPLRTYSNPQLICIPAVALSDILTLSGLEKSDGNFISWEDRVQL